MSFHGVLAVVVGAMIVLAVGVAWGKGSAASGRDLAMACSTCHGLDGNGRIPLAGKSDKELLAQMKAYRRGGSGDAAMRDILSQLSEQDMADLAAYYSAQPRH